MRKRLIELLKGFSYECRNPCGKPSLDSLTENIKDCNECKLGQLADYLLANGVIVPPCKVGDTVYFNKAEIEETCSAKVIGIYNNFYTPSMPLWITIEYESKLIGRQEEKMTSDVFELLCFLTKEEAEAALKGGAE